jgi:DNA modification methylase
MSTTVHYSDDAVTLWHGDARRVSEFIAPESVDLLVTSPPYFALRSYTDAGEHYDGQMGSEATPREFVDNLIAATADWVKVLKPTGSIWVNLGDKYSGSGGHNNSGISDKSTLQGNGHIGGGPKIAATRRQAPDRYNQASDGIPAKSLMGLPWRYANRVVDELGLILRECIIWQKPNGLPESVTDRCRVSHEYLFHFTRQGRYFAAMDEIREPHAAHTLYCAEWERDNHGGEYVRDRKNSARVDGGSRVGPGPNPLGKLPGSVWSMPSEPLVVPAWRIVVNGQTVEYVDAQQIPKDARKSKAVTGTDYTYPRAEMNKWARLARGRRSHRPSLRTLPDHFAAFPSELPRRIILGWSPTAYCTTCDEPRRAVVAKEQNVQAIRSAESQEYAAGASAGGRSGFTRDVQWMGSTSATITGYACACSDTSAPTRPAVVLDPFLGTGTTAAVAKALGRNAIGVDLSRDYLRLAEWRVNDPGIHRKVLERSGVRVPKAPVIDGQLDLLDGAA